MSENRQELAQSQRLSQGLQTALRLLSCDLDELDRQMRAAVQENPALELVPPAGEIPEIALRLRMGPPREGRRPEAAAGESQIARLEQQLRLAALEPDVLGAALAVLHSLNPRGYFIQPLRDFAEETGYAPGLCKRGLHAVQALDPPGIGARDVAECLTLQLAARPDADPLCTVIARGYLMETARRDYAAIARETGADRARVRACCRVIASLTPAPVSLSEEPVRYIVPEFAVEREGDRLTAVFTSCAYPRLAVDPVFSRLASGEDAEAAAYARARLSEAAALQRAVELRQSTLQKLAALILREQRAFFLSRYSLVPLSARDAAAELGVSESTVYRAVRGKYLWCSRGTFPLSHFFQREIAGGVSRARTKELIQALCAGDENLSDRAVSEALGARGISVSRRTVAKYRAELGIESSFRRNAAGK